MRHEYISVWHQIVAEQRLAMMVCVVASRFKQKRTVLQGLKTNTLNFGVVRSGKFIKPIYQEWEGLEHNEDEDDNENKHSDAEVRSVYLQITSHFFFSIRPGLNVASYMCRI